MNGVHDSEAIASALESYFAGEPGVQAGWLFGSHHEGRSHRDSDLDVAVLLDRVRYPDACARFRARIQVTTDLIALLHRNEVDTVVLNDAPPRFARRIVLDGRRVHCANRAAEHAFRRDVQLRAADLGPFLDRMNGIKTDALAR